MLYEFQKIITSIVIVFLVVFGIGKISDIVFKTEENVVAYKVEIQEKVAESEETSDFEGGYNIGYTDSGDFAEYPVLVTESGNYDIKFRVASEFEQGSILLQLIDDSGSQNLTQITLPVTGGWQSWETVSVDVNLDQGI